MSSRVSELMIAAQAGVPVLLWGAPGEGKTSFINALGVALEVPVETVIASIREPADFSGLPVAVQNQWLHWAIAAKETEAAPAWLRGMAAKVAESGKAAGPSGGVELAPPAWAKRLAASGKGILFLDEVSTAPPAVQAALLRVVLDGVVGDLPLPPGVLKIAAANPPEQAAGGWDLSPPLANRFVHLDWQLDTALWIDGMTRGWPAPEVTVLPRNWEDRIPQAAALIASYINHRPDKLRGIPDDATAAGRAWPSPRSWTTAARLIAAAVSVGAGEDTELRLVAGSVGEGHALEFLAWKRDLNLPNPEDLLRNPASFVLPARGDMTFAILTSVVAAVSNNLNNDRWLRAWSVLEAAVDQNAADIAAAVGRTLVKCRRPDLDLPVQQARKLLPLMKTAGAITGVV